MNQMPNDDDINNEQQDSVEESQRSPFLLVISFIAILISAFCFLVLNLKIPAILTFLFVVLINYIQSKRDYQNHIIKSKQKDEDNNARN